MQIIVTNALYHHGILGMHWGIRRYQNRDGSLTAEGIKRYRTDLKFKTKYDKYASKQDAKNQEKAAKREAERINKIKTKSVKDLTDDELRERIARLELEKRMIDLERAVNNQAQGGGQNKQQSDSDRRTNAVMQWGKAAAGSLIKTTTGLATTYFANKIMENVFPDYAKQKNKDKNKNSNNDNSTPDGVVDVVQNAMTGSNSNKKKNKNKNKNRNDYDVDSKDVADTERSKKVITYDDFVNGWDYDKNEMKTPTASNPYKSGFSGSDMYRGDKYDWLSDVGSKYGTKAANIYNFNTDKGYSDMFYGSTVHDPSTINSRVLVDDLLKDFGNRKV